MYCADMSAKHSTFLWPSLYNPFCGSVADQQRSLNEVENKVLKIFATKRFERCQSSTSEYMNIQK